MTLSMSQSKALNLVYYFLNHFNVDHASNIFDPKGIEAYEAFKADQGVDNDLLGRLGQMGQTYRDHIEELISINFIGFGCQDPQDLIARLRVFKGQVSPGSQAFLEAFIQTYQEEWIHFDKYDQGETLEGDLLKLIQDPSNPVLKIMDLMGLPLEVVCIPGLIHYGRACVIDNRLYIGLKSPRSQEDLDQAFLILVHELIHFLTDDLVGPENLVHDLPLNERLVIVFQHMFIQTYYPKWSQAYDRLLNHWEGTYQPGNLGQVFGLDPLYQDKLAEKIDQVRPAFGGSITS